MATMVVFEDMPGWTFSEPGKLAGAAAPPQGISRSVRRPASRDPEAGLSPAGLAHPVHPCRSSRSGRSVAPREDRALGVGRGAADDARAGVGRGVERDAAD